MSGKKGMKKYPMEIREEVMIRIRAGESQRALNQECGISRYAILGVKHIIDQLSKVKRKIRRCIYKCLERNIACHSLRRREQFHMFMRCAKRKGLAVAQNSKDNV